eukprot:Nk52_evm48s96 gene=Nk52_evmTU48s96
MKKNSSSHNPSSSSSANRDPEAALLASSSSSSSCSSSPLSLCTKLGFAIGAWPSSFTHTVIGFYLSPFLLEVARIPAAGVGLLLFVGRFWDSLTDPIVGILSDKTNSRYGRRKPWIVCAALPCALFYLLLWIPITFSSSGLHWAALGYYFVISCLFMTSFTSYYVPYCALTMELTDNIHDRDSAVTYRMAADVFGVAVAAVFQGFMVASANDDYEQLRVMYLNSALGISSVVLFSAVVVTFAVRERPADPIEFERPRTCSRQWLEEHNPLSTDNSSPSDNGINNSNAGGSEQTPLLEGASAGRSSSKQGGYVDSGSSSEKRGVFASLKEDFFDGIMYTFRFGPFRWVTMLYVCAWLNVQMVQNNMILYLKHVSDMGDEFQTILLCLLLTTFMSTPLLGFSVKHLGKPKTFILGMGLLIPIELMLWSGIKSGLCMYLLSALSGVGVSTAYLLPSVMLPDVIDMAERETGIRREGSFYSFFVFAQKFGSGIALSFSNILLGLGGYVTGSEAQPESVSAMLCRLLGLFPAILAALSLICLHKYLKSVEIQESRIKK